jgi:cytochrome P450
MIMEIIKDAHLHEIVKREISKSVTTDGPSKGEIDPRRLSSMPVIQSIFAEILRLHTSFLITRSATDTVEVGGYTIPKGSIIQAPTDVAHFDEEICKCSSAFALPS